MEGAGFGGALLPFFTDLALLASLNHNLLFALGLFAAVGVRISTSEFEAAELGPLRVGNELLLHVEEFE